MTCTFAAFRKRTNIALDNLDSHGFNPSLFALLLIVNRHVDVLKCLWSTSAQFYGTPTAQSCHVAFKILQFIYWQSNRFHLIVELDVLRNL